MKARRPKTKLQQISTRLNTNPNPTQQQPQQPQQQQDDEPFPSIPQVQDRSTKSSVISALKVCISLRDLNRGRKLHHLCKHTGLETDVFIATSLIEMYSKCSSMPEAHHVFENINIQRRDVFCWNTLMLGYLLNGDPVKALSLYHQLPLQPNSRTYVAALTACTALWECGGTDAHADASDCGTGVHSDARRRGMDTHVVVANALVDFYARCGDLTSARGVFDSMSHPNVITSTSLIQGYVENGQGEAGLELFNAMEHEPDGKTLSAALRAVSSIAEGELVDRDVLVKVGSICKGLSVHARARGLGLDSDLFVATELVEMYARCGCMLYSRTVFDRMQQHDVVAWNALIRGYCDSLQPGFALDLFHRMSCSPDSRTIVASLSACSGLAQQEVGRRHNGKVIKPAAGSRVESIHSSAEELGMLHQQVFIANSLISAYSTCGYIKQARAVFEMIDSHHRDVVSWTSVISAHAENGEASTALELLKRMSLQPNSLTLTAGLNACGDLIDLSTGRMIHSEICRQGALQACLPALVEFYGRCGRTAVAQLVFDSASGADAATWSACLSGYSRQGDTRRVFRLFRDMLDESARVNGGALLAVLATCAHAGLVETGKRVFERMRCGGFGPVPVAVDHFHCFVDLLGRADRIEEAIEVVEGMPYEADACSWTIVLGACQKWKNVRLGEFAFGKLVEVNARVGNEQATAYVLMGNIYGSVEMWEERGRVMSELNSLRRKVSQV